MLMLHLGFSMGHKQVWGMPGSPGQAIVEAYRQTMETLSHWNPVRLWMLVNCGQCIRLRKAKLLYAVDTASEVTLLGVSAIAVRPSGGGQISNGEIIILPALFTCGMSLVDSVR